MRIDDPGEGKLTDLPTPSAARLSKARWLDARLLAGVMLVLLSVVLGAKVVAEADDSVPVWALTADLAPDAVLTMEDLQRVDVRLGSGMDQYILARGEGPVGYVVTRELRRGELLPAGALASDDLADKRRVTVAVDQAAVQGLVRSSVVDVYVVPESRAGEEQPPARKVLESVSVAADPGSDKALGAGRGATGVDLLVPGEQVQQLLTDLASGTPALVEVPKLRAGAEAGP